jgi:hypothetical protein
MNTSLASSWAKLAFAGSADDSPAKSSPTPSILQVTSFAESVLVFCVSLPLTKSVIKLAVIENARKRWRRLLCFANAAFNDNISAASTIPSFANWAYPNRSAEARTCIILIPTTRGQFF